MKEQELKEKLFKQFIYEDEGKKYVDYCHNCDNYITQVEIIEGEFGCEICRHTGNIECKIKVN